LPKVFARLMLLKPVKIEKDGITLTLYESEEISWREIEVDEDDRDKLVNKMVNEASSLAYQNKINEGYSFALLEIPGIEVVEGEGKYSSAETIFYPKPSEIQKIVLYKVNGDKVLPVKEIRIEGGKYIYDGSFNTDIDFDLIEITTSDGVRIMLKEDLKLSVVTKAGAGKSKETKTRTRRRRRKSRTRKKKKK